MFHQCSVSLVFHQCITSVSPVFHQCFTKNLHYFDHLAPSRSCCTSRNFFNYEENQHKTTLAAHVWDLKRKNIDHSVTWKILDRGKPFSPVSNLCNLCTKEKYYIIFEPEEATLNKRDELNNCCLHKSPVLLDKT